MQEIRSEATPRHIPQWVASAVAEFEMFGKEVVSVRDIAGALAVTPDSRRLKNAVHDLVRLGWLRPLPTRGLYEYLPARGGPYPSGDPLLEARAVLTRRPDFRLAMIGTGAAFLRGFSERAPGGYAVAITREQGGSVALGSIYQLVKTTPSRIDGIPKLRDVPVSDAAHLLADAALWPSACGDLRHADHWLRRALLDTTPDAASATANRVGHAGAARMAYIAARFEAVEIATAIAATLRLRAKTSIGRKGAPVVSRDPSLGVDDRLGVATLR